MFDTILHIIWHAIEESIITLPILFICYLLIELLEEKILNKYQKNKNLKSVFSPIVSAGFGLIPQCGFSVVASDLYSKKVITIGSLFAILIATSDEALPIMIANPANYGSLAIILGVKFVYAVVVGTSIDVISNAVKKSKEKKSIELKISTQTGKIADKNTKSINKNKTHNLTVSEDIKVQTGEFEAQTHNDYDHEVIEKEESGHSHEHSHHENYGEHEKHSHEHVEVHGCCNHNLEKSNNKIKDLFVHPLMHSLKIFAFILLINILFGALVEFVGEDSIANFMASTGFFEPFLVSLVGLIPNCAASVIITELFLVGGISIGSCISGLCINSGIALIMLFKMNKNLKQNLGILFSLYALSCLIGVVINLF